MSERFTVEEVENVAPPPRAKVEDARETFERKRDYLAGFLDQKPEAAPAGGPGGDLQAAIVETLKTIYDPEIPVDIYELGLIYDVAPLPGVDLDALEVIEQDSSTDLVEWVEIDAAPHRRLTNVALSALDLLGSRPRP